MNVIDLFSGCGGMSLGCKWAGCKTVLAIDSDKSCKATFNHNFPNVPFICGDIRNIPAHKVLQNIGKNIDVIVGGPPCQGFSLANKNRDKQYDERNNLLFEFVRFVSVIQPKSFVLENVRGLISKNKGAVLKKLLKEFEISGIGYRVSWKLVTASDYGVPQHRKRIIIIGYREDLGKTPSLEKLNTFKNNALQKTYSLWEGISDLPMAKKDRLDTGVLFLKQPQNNYQKFMRNNAGLIYNHIPMRHTKRIIERFKTIEIGQSLANVSQKHLPQKRGNASEKSTCLFSQNNQRLHPNLPAPTITASFQSNFIHPFLHRNLTAREAARLQSFPDTFVFKGKRTTMSWEKGLSQYQQIGNAVPPLLSFAILQLVQSELFEKKAKRANLK